MNNITVSVYLHFWATKEIKLALICYFWALFTIHVDKMRTILPLVLMTFSLSSCGVSSEMFNVLKSDHNTLKADFSKFQSEYAELKGENEWLKQKYTDGSEIIFTEAADIVFEFVSAKYVTGGSTLTVIITATNKSSDKEIVVYYDMQAAIDDKGNEYGVGKPRNVKFGKGGSRNFVYKNTPVRIELTFQEVKEKPSKLTLLNIGFWNNKDIKQKVNAQLRNLPVE